MLHSMIGRELSSNQELLSITGECIEAINTLYGRATLDCLQAEVDEILANKEEQWKDKLIALIQEDGHREIWQVNTGLSIMRELCIRSGESEELSALLEKLSSVEELQLIWQNVVFYLRRMEFDMSDEECEPLLDLIEACELPTVFLRMVLEQGDLYDRKKVGQRLNAFLHRNRYEE